MRAVTPPQIGPKVGFASSALWPGYIQSRAEKLEASEGELSGLAVPVAGGPVSLRAHTLHDTYIGSVGAVVRSRLA